MKKDKLKVYFLQILLLIILFFALFVSNIFNRMIVAIILAAYAVVVTHALKKRNILSIYRKQVTILMLVFAVIYLLGFYLMGLYFGYYRAVVQLSTWSVITYIIPLSIIVISSEVIRNVFISQKARLSKVFAFIALVLVDLIVYTNIYDILTLTGFLNIVGFVLFASIACNLLYNYICSRFGHKPVIVYRLITVLYAYIIPIIPDVYIFFRSFLRMVFPYVIYMTLEYTYAKSNFAIAYKDKQKNILGTTCMLAITTLIIMLVSCQFKYGILVIGSSSMAGNINKGDAIIYERYDGGLINKDEVIVFKRDNIKVIHRVIDVRVVNDEYRYYTKGDANMQRDDGYVTAKDIIGTTDLRIKYIGYPSLWLRDIFIEN